VPVSLCLCPLWGFAFSRGPASGPAGPPGARGLGWFWRRPRGGLPTGAFRLETMPDTMLERVLLPAGDVILHISTAVRRLQHGRLQAYILYVVAGLAAMAGLVAMGGLR